MSCRLQDGRRATTVDYRAYLDPPPARIVQRVRGRSVSEMLQRHRDWIGDIGASLVQLDPKDLPRLVLESEQQTIDRLIERGVYVKANVRDLARVERRGRAATPPELIASPFYRLLRYAERILFLVLMIAILWNWTVPLGGPHRIPQLQIRSAVFLGSFAGFWAVKLIQFVLKRWRPPAGKPYS